MARSLTCCLATSNSELASCWLATIMRYVMQTHILVAVHYPVNATDFL